MHIKNDPIYNLLMEKQPPEIENLNKKKIVVKKLKPNPSAGFHFDDDTYIPLAANDSAWTGIEIMKEKSNVSSDENEEEIQVIELEPTTESTHSLPLFQLFPDLQKNNVIITQQMSTTNVTKMLVGKKPDFSLLKSSRKLQINPRLSSVMEDTESSESYLSTNRKLFCR